MPTTKIDASGVTFPDATTASGVGAAAGKVAAGDHAHSLVQDLVASAQTGTTCAASTGAGTKTQSIAGGADFDLATTTNTFAANSRAVAVGYAQCSPYEDNEFKLRLYMGGVQVAESAYIPGAGQSQNTIVVGTRALSGSQICKIALHNYAAGSDSVIFMAIAIGQPVGAGIGVGSIKI